MCSFITPVADWFRKSRNRRARTSKGVHKLLDQVTATTRPHARRAGFFKDLVSVGTRSLRSLKRDVETLIPALIIPGFFYAVNLGALQDFAESIPGLDYKAFQLPVASLFAVTGLSRANALVLDIQRGYFDRLALTPANRLAFLLGLMVADGALALLLTLMVIIIGVLIGVSFATAIPGILIFLLLNLLWAAVYNGIPYALALKTGNPTVVNTSFLLFFPFVFMAPLYLPREYLTGWLSTIATFNPVTYLLEGLRSLINGWDGSEIGLAFASIAGLGAVTIPLALWALNRRVRQS